MVQCWRCGLTPLRPVVNSPTWLHVVGSPHVFVGLPSGALAPPPPPTVQKHTEFNWSCP